ncbi:MAG TPA: hypothetical protein VJT31_05890, partial [Rugosimonospora sp.]|nr:hypothetical protein [Rugosimonospora sp.]
APAGGADGGWSDRRLLAVLVTVAATAFLAAVRLRLHAMPSGDEPAYLVISQTLQKYHSVDILRDHLHGDYHSFYRWYLQPHVVTAPNGHRLPLHSIGGPLLWLVPFILWGRAGACLLIALISVLIVANTYRFLREQEIGPGYAFLATLLLALASPVYVYSSMTFVEPIGALVLLYAVRVALAPKPHPGRVLTAAVGVAYLPWVHPRFLMFALVLAGLLAFRLWRDRRGPGLRPYLAVLVPLGVSLALLELYTVLVWGSVNPVVNSTANGDGPFQIPLHVGLMNLFFDRQVGLIANYPVFLLVLPGILLSARRTRPLRHAAIAAVVVPYLLLVGTFADWWAGYSPPARFLVVIVPLLTYYLAYALQRLDSILVACAALLLGAASYAASLTSDLMPSARFSTFGKPNRALVDLTHAFGGTRLLRFIPSGSAPGGQHGLFLAWLAGTVLLGAGLWAVGRRHRARLIPAAAAN